MIAESQAGLAQRASDDAAATPLLTAKDLYEVVRLVGQGIIAWTLPERTWWPVSRFFGRLNVACHPSRTRSEVTRIAAAIAGTAADGPGNARSIATENWSNRYEERFQYLRAWRPDDWKPAIDVAGAENITKARDAGRGILLYTSNFCFYHTVTKMAWHRLGLSVGNFAGPFHGFSATRFGLRFLNPIYKGVEDRYVERVTGGVTDNRSALELLRERLESGGVVSIAVGDRGRRQARVAFLSTGLKLATGPFFLARSTGAALLPVFSRRLGPAHFEVDFGPPIEIAGDSDDDYRAAIHEYADLLTPYVLRDPGQWKGWRFTTSEPAVSSKSS